MVSYKAPYGLVLVLILLAWLSSMASAWARQGGNSDDDAAPAAASEASDTPLKQAQRALQNGDYQHAIALLEALPGSPNADVLNLLGYSHRKLQHYDQALRFYQRALALDPQHKGANEYLGELYLETHQPDKARQRLAILATICTDCEEYQELKDALANYRP